MAPPQSLALASSPPATVQNRIPVWFGVVLVTALWLMARPYVGLRHDGVIYLGQALRHLNPGMMANDLFFAYGSQDSYTVFGRLLALLYQRLDIAVAQIVVLALCQVALMVTLFRLLKPLASDLERWLGLVAIAVMSHVYGGFGLLSFAERFVTARTPAEPLLLLSLALLMGGRTLGALLVMAVAGAIHPLMTLPVALVVWLVLLQRDRRWAYAALALVIPVGLAAAQIKPFDALLQRYDADWWRPVSDANGMVLLTRWQLEDWHLVGFDLALLALAARWLPTSLSPLFLAAGIATVVSFLISVVGADLLRNVLITQLQIWRVMWLSHVLALAVLPAMVLRAWRLKAGGPLFALALASAAVAVNARWLTSWMFIAWAVVTGLMAARREVLSAPLARAAFGVTALALAGMSVVVLHTNAEALAAWNEVPLRQLDLPNWVLVAFTMPSIAFPVAAPMLVAWQRGNGSALLAGLLGAGALLWGVATWDRRVPWTRAIESGLGHGHPFQAHIPKNAQVYWQDGLAASWVYLERPSYLSPQQGSGMLFSRRTALEVERRQRAFEPLFMQRDLCRTITFLTSEKRFNEQCWPTQEVVDQLCRIPSGPDFLIFETRLDKARVAEWTFAATREGDKDRTFYLYDCAQLR